MGEAIIYLEDYLNKDALKELQINKNQFNSMRAFMKDLSNH